MLRVGIIVDEGPLPWLVTDLIYRAAASSDIEIAAFIAQTFPGRSPSLHGRIARTIRRKGVVGFLSVACLSVIERFEERMASTKLAPSASHDPCRLKPIPRIEVIPKLSPSGLVYRYADSDIERIKALGLDVLVRGGSGILKGAILTATPHGILSFHHADNRVNRGGPPGFWEVYAREPATGFIVQRLTEELDGGEVLLRGALPTATTYVENRNRLYRKSAPFFLKALERIAGGNAVPVEEPRPYDRRLLVAPGLGQLVAYAWRTYGRKASRGVSRLLRRTSRWGVAYRFVDNWRDTVLWRATRIPNLPGHFFADPCLAYKDGRHICFVEDLDYSAGRGSIRAFELERSGHRDLGTVLEEPFHLSFPFVVEDHDGTLLMCPETMAARQVRLYRCDRFPDRWSLAEVVLDGVSACDTTIAPHQGRWWMLTNIDSADLGECSSELHLFWSDRLVGGQWKPHPLNPVINDPLIARNGGLIVEGNTLFRVFQRQGYAVYGEGWGVARIDRMDPHAYREIAEFAVEPRFLAGIKGSHSFTHAHGVVAFDFVQEARRG